MKQTSSNYLQADSGNGSASSAILKSDIRTTIFSRVRHDDVSIIVPK